MEIINDDPFDNEAIKQLIKESGLDMFIIIILNKVISNLGLKEHEFLENYLSFFSKIDMEKYLNKKIVKLLSLYLKQETKLYEKINLKLSEEIEIDQNLFIILLYGLRYCFQSIDKNNLYGCLFDNDCSSILKQYYIPGNHILDDLHLFTLFDIEEHINEYPSDKGCYICSCGYYYSIDPCGFPHKEQFSNCPKCKKFIGYCINKKQEKLEYCIEQREGHYRIFKNDDDKKAEMSKYNITDTMVPNKLYKDYLNEIINPILEQENPGLNIIKKDIFLSTHIKIRNLSKIGYRLLNFIIYSHLFFANCLGYISDDELKKDFLVEDMTCAQIIETNWNLLKESLYEKSINSVEIFMNSIFVEICKAFNECKSLKTLKERNNFEDKIEEIIKENIKNYNKFKEVYLKENLKELSSTKIENIKVIVNEMIEPEKYSQKYPLFKYFMFTKYPDKKEFIKKLKEIGDEIFSFKYPLTYQYLSDEISPNKMKYLFDINEFCNYMLDYYSFKIPRETAEEKKIIEIQNDDFPTNQFNKFIETWKKVVDDIRKFKGKTAEIIELSEDKKLINFLNDDKNKNILSAYQYFISNQNSFLQPICNAISFNGVLHFYVNNLKNKIPIQDAKYNNILSFDDVNFESIIYKYSKRKILNKNGKIDYFNYNTFYFDFDSIEKELGELILPGKCLFEENKLRFISFWFEGNTDIYTHFSEIYKQKSLNKEQEKQIDSYFTEEEINEINKILKILSSFQSMISYLINNKYEEEENIEIIFNQLPDYFKIDNKIKKLFKNEKFKINQLLNIFFYVENLFFDKIKENIINENDNFKKSFDDNKDLDSLRDIIQKIDLYSALRRYILRYLIDKSYANHNLDKKLSLELTRTELWDVNETKFNEIKEILIKEFGKLNLIKKEAITLYEFIKNIKES